MKSVAVAGIQETNRNFERTNVAQSFHSCFRHTSTHHQGSVSSAQLHFQSDYQPGGTAVMALNKWATRFLSKGSDVSGRWSWLTLVGSGTLKITFISAYRVCDGATYSNPELSTVRSQLKWMNASRGLGKVQVRQQFDSDLSALITTFQKTGHDIVLMMDANEKDGINSFCDRLCNQCQLIDAHSLAAAQSPPPATFALGSAQIDFVLISGRLVPAVRAASILALYDGFTSDHRALVVDFDANMLFSAKTTDVIQPSSRRLTSTQPKAVHLYLHNMLAFVTRHNIAARVMALSERSDGGSWDSLDIQEWERIDLLLLKGRAESERKCPPKPSGRFPWSPDLGRAGKWLSYWKLRIVQARTGACNVARLQNLQNLLQVPLELIGTLSLERLVVAARLAQKQFREIKTEARLKRQQHLEEMGRFAGSVHKMAPDAAIRRIEASEKASGQYRVLRSIFRDGQATGFDRLDIPDSFAVLRKDETVPRISLVVQEEIEAVLLPHTVRRFQQHAETPFGNGERKRRLGTDCTSPDARALADGTYDYRLLELTEEAREWLLQLKTRDYVGCEGLINTRVTTEEWIRGWSRMRESTASAPGAGHYGHYKAISVAARLPTDHEDHSTVLADLYARMWSMPLVHGFSPSRWRNCVDAILEKIPGKPMLEKLRIIMLYEADFNFVLKLVWGKKLVCKAEHHLSLGECNHGSRAGRQTHDALLQKLLLYEQARLTRTSLITVDNDAKSCYDRIIKTLALLACMSFGLSVEAAKMHNDTHNGMKHSIKSRHGLFTPYGGDTMDGMEGSGQGSGASPAIWLLFSTTLLQAFSRFSKGMDVVCPFGQVALCILAIFYVDDGTPGVSDITRPRAESLRLLVHRAQSTAQSWERLLFASGGALEFSKCFTYTMYWDLSNGHHRLLTPQELPGCKNVGDSWVGPISLTYGSSCDAKHPLVSESPWDGRKTLGVRIAPAGGWKDEFTFRLQQSRDLARRLMAAKLPTATARLAYRMLICPKLEYPLSVTQFTEDQCHRLASPIICATLSCMGYNQHMPRAIVFGPASLGGLAMHDLYIEQGIKHLSELLGHVRQQSTTGAMMRAQLQWCQLQAGCGFHLLKTPHILIDYIEDCWIMCIRDFLRKFQLRVEFNSLLQQELLCDKDEFIMDALRERGDCTYVELQRLNACRMWHKVSRLSEISTLDGKQLLLGPLTGGKIEQYSSSLKWPRQGCPMRKDWNLWRRKLQLVFSINGKSCTLRQNLGKWRPGCLCLQEWKTVAYSTPGGVTVFCLNSDGTVKRTGTAIGPRGIVRFHQIQAMEVVLPAQVSPVALVTRSSDQSTRLDMRGCYPVVAFEMAAPTEPPTFMELVNSQPPHIRAILQWCTAEDTDAQKMITCLQQNAKIDACADGGLLHNVGTFGYVFGDSGTSSIIGAGKGYVSGGAFPMTSTRPELGGVFACLSYLRLVLEFANIPSTTKLDCTIYCDSKAALARIENLRYKRFGTTWRCRANYDIEAAIGTCIDSMAVNLTFCWVRSHATRRLKAGSVLSWDESLNEAADHLATLARDLQVTRLSAPWPEQLVCISSVDGELNGKLDKDLRYHCTASDLMDFWKEKFRWSDSVVTSVELEGTAQAMRRLPVAATARICKLRCGWLPVNERESMIDPDRKPGCSACSTVGLNPETIDHMFECQSTSRVALIENKFASFNATMQSLGTCKYIRRTLRFGLLYWVKGNVPLEIADFALPDSPLGLLVARAYTEQSLIGWNMAFRGFLSQSWKTAQELHFSQDLSRGTVNGTTWVATIVSWLFELFAEVWAQRNLDEFGVDLEDQRKKKLVLCERAIRRLHAVGQTLPDSERFPFRTDIETLLSKRLPIQERWISSTERFLPGALKRVAARAASGQRSITEFFKRKTVEVVEDRVDREVADSGVT